MKVWKRRLLLAVALALCLTACGARPTPTPAADTVPTATPAPTVTPTEAVMPTPQPTPAPDPAPAPSGPVIEYLDALLYDGSWQTRFWIFPGSGPVSVEMPEAEYGDALRELLASYDWQLTEAPGYDENAVIPPDSYFIGIYPRTASNDGMRPMTFSAYDPVLHLSAWENSGDLFYTAPGAEDLCEAVAGLWPGWEAVTGCRTRVPPQGDKEALARAYLEATFDKLRENGHIQGACVDSLEIIPPVYNEENVGSNYMSYDEFAALQFKTAFSLRPTRPELTYWQEQEVDKDGWAHYELSMISLSQWGDDGLYELGWFSFEM